MTLAKVVFVEKKGAIATITMADEVYKNTFSNALITGVIQAIDEINRDKNIHVVVIHGYGNYFCCGGTKEDLLKMQGSEITYLAFPIFDVLLRCQVPVISAMQGHALGGGLAFGCFGDILLLAEECIYSASFMKYGFTPGMGATYIIPKKFGTVIGSEMLMTAKTYTGRDLKTLGVPVRVVSKLNILAEAQKIAESLAEKPRQAFCQLKTHLNQDIRAKLPGIIEAELSMHAATFSDPKTRDRIEQFFDH